MCAEDECKEWKTAMGLPKRHIQRTVHELTAVTDSGPVYAKYFGTLGFEEWSALRCGGCA